MSFQKRAIKPHQSLFWVLFHCHQNYPFFFDSSSFHEDCGRYSILFKNPKKTDSFAKQVIEQKNPIPFVGGYVFFAAYEWGYQIDPVFNQHPKFNNPFRVFRVSSALIVDHLKNEVYAVDEQNDFEHLWQDWERFSAHQAPISCQDFSIDEEDEKKYINGIKKIQKYIYQGDTYQVNLSRLWQAHCQEEINSISTYARLRKANPAPFSAWMKFDDFTLLSSSPERLLRIDKADMESRPIAGTRKRVGQLDYDLKMQDELKTNLKEDAEHVMMVDMIRNDLGKCAQIGSVDVRQLKSIESYAYVHHIVSSVVAKIDSKHSYLDALKALFPGATITGCPKIRTMEIIAELEQSARKAYTGSVGYLSLDGSFDSNILIRSMMVYDNILTFRAGGGIVLDAHPKHELRETQHKAQGLIRALL